jgi:type II secretory pathway pseudopilin PulG
MGKNGQTLLEILASLIILAMVVAGLAQVFLSAKKFAIHSRSRMAAAQMGKVFLDNLQIHVNATSWDIWYDNGTVKNDLVNTAVTGLRYCDDNATGNHTQQSKCPSDAERTLDKTIYNATYKITTDTFDPGGFGLLRQVTLNITWNETALY